MRDTHLKRTIAKLLSGAPTPDELIEVVLQSAEAKARIFNDIWKDRTTIYRMNITRDRERMRKLYTKTARYWRHAGLKEEEVYFSVLTAPKYKRRLSEDEIREFYASGAKFVDFCMSRLRERGIVDFHELTCLDFGCGVGRLAFNASMHVKEVYAVDLSEGHLKLLKENMSRFPSLHRNNITAIYLHDLLDISHLPMKVDFIYSFISLQHNTPPVIAFIVRELLKMLQEGGYACLHIPIHHPFYSFSEEAYLASENAGARLEVHILPRENIREAAREAGATLVDSFGFGGSRGIYSEIFLFQSESMRTERDASSSSSSSDSS